MEILKARKSLFVGLRTQLALLYAKNNNITKFWPTGFFTLLFSAFEEKENKE